jgi:outer membrane lipoprotein-sorting protein
MKRTRLAIMLLLLAAPSLHPAAGDTAKLDRVLRKLNQLNKVLRTFQADLIQRKYLNIIQEYDELEKGKFSFKKEGGKIYLKKQIEEPGKTILLVTPEEILVYYPKKNQAVRRKIEESQARYANFGIGTSVEDLKSNFDITYLHDEVDRKKVYHVITLNPKNAKLRSYFKTLNLWIEAETGIPARQRIEEPNGDYTDIQFLNIEINKKVKDKTFEIKLPKDVEFIS